MKYATIILAVIFLSEAFFAFGQEYREMIESGETDFFKIQSEAEEYFSGRTKGRGSGYKQYKRWERFWISRLDEGGRMTSQGLRRFGAMKELERKNTKRITHGLWEDMGPNEYSLGYNNAGGNGRVNCIAIDPSDPNTIYLGTPAGGLWKSVNGGSSWTPLTDGIPSIGVSGICIHPDSSDLIYILTGDGDGGNSYSVGVLKSTDGGVTWQKTGYSYQQQSNQRGYKMIMHPEDPNTLFLATSNGIVKTIDGFRNFQYVASGWFTDIEFKPGEPDVMYAARSAVNYSVGGFYRSLSGGGLNTWVRNSTPILDTLDKSDFHRMAIAVTPLNPNIVYLLAGKDCSSADTSCHGYKALYRSLDGGGTFTIRSSSPNILGWNPDGSGYGSQANYDLDIAIDPVASHIVYVGGVDIWKSQDGGTTWTNIAHWAGENNPYGYTHADIHALVWNGTTLFVGSDGGFFKSVNSGDTWINLSAGLGIMQFTYIDVVGGIIVGGSQDNGSSQWTTSSMTAINSLGGDGFACAIDYNNTNIRYLSHQHGRRKSVNGGIDYQISIDTIYPGSNMNDFWGSDFLLHPTNPSKLVNAQKMVYLSSDYGETWTILDPQMPNDKLLNDMEQGKSDPNWLYITDRLTIKVTNNLYDPNPVWQDISAGLPLSSTVGIEQITSNPDDPSKVWIGLTGYSNGNKVFYSPDGGLSWQNQSGNLPNLPVNAIAYHPGSANGIYLGTDIGVFYKDDSMYDWIYFNNGLPNVVVTEFDVDGSHVYAATFGRGVWRSEHYTPCPLAILLTPSNDPSSSGVQRYSATISIVSTRIVQGGTGTDVAYKAGDYVQLNPGFEVRPHSVFHAKIGDCPQ